MSEIDQVEIFFDHMALGHQSMTELLRASLGERRTIDEMALLFPNSTTLFSFISNAVKRPGVELFNCADDTVTTAPIVSVYRPQYWFLTTGNPAYRLECMLCSKGSPLHDTFLRELVHNQTVAAMAVHASFKCTDEEDYATALRTLRADGWELLQRCTAGYGKYSYWHNPDAPERAEWLLKARLNMRDAA